MKRISISILLLIFGMMLYSCSSSIPKPEAAHSAWAKKHWANIDLAEGRKAYVTNCSGCHSLHSPAEHTSEEWKVLFGEMVSKTGMNAGDSISVIAYLDAFSKDTRIIY